MNPSPAADPFQDAHPFHKVLIANRSEIAVRVIRACADAGLGSVAVYSESDRNSMHVRMAGEAYALGGLTAAETYLDIDKLIDVARRSGADAVHPGYGFLSESAEFAWRVQEAGLIWIGPPPGVIDDLGNKVSARRLAISAGAPLVPGTADPVADAAEVEAFAAVHGLPIAIKAAYGGGGRGLKVVRDIAEIPEAFDSAVREARAAFGRGECFVERYLDRPRHVETQCLADAYGTVVVVSTRDCTLQRRHQKLIEEAPAPFLTDAQLAELERASKALLASAGYVGAGTVEFLLASDGSIAFLEVNTRLQVEHPVTEAVTGLDLVREQFRIAAGEPLGYDTIATSGHAFEFRINGEDPATGFLPQPGTISSLRWPGGPGVRIDAGVEQGDDVPGYFDSMLAKVIVSGRDRIEALARARRALGEVKIVGLPTVLPFHRAVLDEPDFAAARDFDGFRVHTRWIETDYAERLAALHPQEGAATAVAEPPKTERVVVEVGGKRLEVVLPAGFGAIGAGAPAPSRRPARRHATSPASSAQGTQVAAPMQGTLVKVAVRDGQHVAEGELIAVLEAMKMEQPLVAHRAGRIDELRADIGASIAAGSVICHIVD